jgi:P27 family predicted phage terminase small subunit
MSDTPPTHLSARAKALWKDLVPRRAKSAGRRALLLAALEALDRAEEARKKISKTGLTTTTKSTGAVHLNPLVKLEREARQQFARIWSDLHFGFDARVDGIAGYGAVCIGSDDDE